MDMAVRSPQDSTAALSVALQHPAVSSDLKHVCTLLQVCKSWRVAVQQSAAGHTNVCLAAKRNQLQLPRLVGFAAWFPQHQGLVGTLNIGSTEDLSHDDNKWPVPTTVALPVLEVSMQYAAMTAANQSRPMQLRSFTTDRVISYNISSALPAESLTALDIRISVPEGRCVEAISKLSSLQQLTLRSMHGQQLGLGPESLLHLTRLSQLTKLHLQGISSAGHLQLPKQLRRVTLTYGPPQTPPHLHLLDLTCLQHLEVHCDEPAAGTTIPTQLQVLEVMYVGGFSSRVQFSALEAFHIRQLRKLRSLSLHFCGDSLGALVGLPQLQQLVITNTDLTAVLEATAVWQSIPQLCSLSINVFRSTAASEFRQLVQQVATLTSLTKLQLGVRIHPGQQQALDGFNETLCEYLARLTQLRELRLGNGIVSDDSAAHDAHHLSVLTALTELDLPVIDETTAVQLAVTLTNLEWLCIGQNNNNDNIHKHLWSTAPLPAIGRLTRLRHLNLSGVLGETAGQMGRSYLTALTRLTSLALRRRCA